MEGVQGSPQDLSEAEISLALNRRKSLAHGLLIQNLVQKSSGSLYQQR